MISHHLRGLASLLAGLMGIDLAVREFFGTCQLCRYESGRLGLLTTLAGAARVSRSAGALALAAVAAAAAAMSTLLAGLMGINLAIGELWMET